MLMRTNLSSRMDLSRLRVAYQPIVGLGDEKLIGHEALARLVTPEGVIIAAEAFIGAASECDFESEIDAQITAMAMQTTGGRIDGRGHAGKIFLNCCARFLEKKACIEALASQHGQWTAAQIDATVHACARPNPWVLELTERRLDADPKQLLETLAPLMELGFTLALDDFAGEHSAFPYLLNLPFRYLKLDRSLVQAAPGQVKSQKVMRHLCAMASDLGMITIAEGIEHAAELDCALTAGVDWGQGYLWGEASVNYSPYDSAHATAVNSSLSWPAQADKTHRPVRGPEGSLQVE